MRIALSIPAKVIFKVLSLVSELAWVRSMFISTLKNKNVKEVQRVARNYVEHELPPKIIPSAFNILANHENIIIVSSSLEPVIEAIHEKIEAEAYFCTTLEKSGDKYTGDIKKDASGMKWEILKETEYESSISASAFITDNKNDIELLKKTGKRFVVSDQKDKSYWRKKLDNLEFIFIDPS